MHELSSRVNLSMLPSLNYLKSDFDNDFGSMTHFTNKMIYPTKSFIIFTTFDIFNMKHLS